MKLYLAGPMTGYKDFNFPAFMAAAKMLREMGHEVFNPAENDLERDGELAEAYTKSETGDVAEAEAKGFDKRVAIKADLSYIIDQAEGIALLPGWERSKGANAEFWTAQFLGLEVLTLVPAEQADEQVPGGVEAVVEAAA
jgi:hypothetical protein